jgi:HTH-type transcriptional regulator/antitoxin HigA
MSSGTLTIDAKKYGRLLARTLPIAIKTEQEYDRMVSQAGKLMEKGAKELSPEEEALLETVVVLIERYDQEHYPLGSDRPQELIKFLMEQRGLRPRDLWEVFGSKGITSEVLSGKRRISIGMAKKLGNFFHVAPELFLDLAT